MHQSYSSNNTINTGDDWILLINDDSSQSINIDDYSTTTSTKTRTSSDKSFNSDDALALRILDDTYDFEAQRPFVFAYPIQHNKSCYEKSISSCTFKHTIPGYVFIFGVWIFLGVLLYVLTRL